MKYSTTLENPQRKLENDLLAVIVSLWNVIGLI